jgi:uncharacterized membrane protein
MLKTVTPTQMIAGAIIVTAMTLGFIYYLKVQDKKKLQQLDTWKYGY